MLYKGYGPDSCFKAHKDTTTGTCIVSADCSGVDSDKFTTFMPGFVCRTGDVLVTHAFDNDDPAHASFGPSETFDSNVKVIT